jgi:DNA-binding transcriptional MerR regulator
MRVEELAASSGVSVDTIRYYQGMGLLDSPERHGRTVRYAPVHLDQLDAIRRLADAGFSLAQIKQLTSDGTPVLKVLADEMLDKATLTKAELAERSGIAEPLIELAVTAGLLEPAGEGDDALFSEQAVVMLSAGRTLLEAGIPFDRLAALATRHATGIEDVVEEAIELVADYVRPGQSDDPTDLATLFELLFSHTTRLVAQHFYQTLVARALHRLEDSDDESMLDAVRGVTGRDLVISTEWR